LRIATFIAEISSHCGLWKRFEVANLLAALVAMVVVDNQTQKNFGIEMAIN